MKKYIQYFQNKKILAIFIGSILLFSLILIITLNLQWALLTVGIFLNLVIFYHSFHYGLIFSVIIILLFPVIYIIDREITLSEIFLLILGLVGFVNLIMDRHRITIFPLFYYWIFLMIMSLILVIIDSGNNAIFSLNRVACYHLSIIFIIFPIIIMVFQYFFQTIKRLEKFFIVIIIVGLVHSLFALAVLLLNLNLSSGLGISNGFFDNINHKQLTGFLGNHIFLQLGANGLTTLLAITIPITIGLWLICAMNLSVFSFKKWLKVGLDKSVDSILKNKTKKSIINLKKVKKISKKEHLFFIFVILLQSSVLILSSAYLILVVLLLGIFIIGILLRNKYIITTILMLLLIFTIVLPGFNSNLSVQSHQQFLDFWNSFKKISNLNWIWYGVNDAQWSQIYNSYLLIFNKFGLIGCLIFLGSLGQYFYEIRKTYLKSDGVERIWLIIILAIFVEFVILAFFSNLFFVGPSALLFWLLYAVLQNLKYNKIKFGLTETKLNNKLVSK